MAVRGRLLGAVLLGLLAVGAVPVRGDDVRLFDRTGDSQWESSGLRNVDSLGACGAPTPLVGEVAVVEDASSSGAPTGVLPPRYLQVHTSLEGGGTISFDFRYGEGPIEDGCDAPESGEEVKLQYALSSEQADTYGVWHDLDGPYSLASHRAWSAKTVTLSASSPAAARDVWIRWVQLDHGSDAQDVFAVANVKTTTKGCVDRDEYQSEVSSRAPLASTSFESTAWTSTWNMVGGTVGTECGASDGTKAAYFKDAGTRELVSSVAFNGKSGLLVEFNWGRGTSPDTEACPFGPLKKSGSFNKYKVAWSLEYKVASTGPWMSAGSVSGEGPENIAATATLRVPRLDSEEIYLRLSTTGTRTSPEVPLRNQHTGVIDNVRVRVDPYSEPFPREFICPTLSAEVDYTPPATVNTRLNMKFVDTSVPDTIYNTYGGEIVTSNGEDDLAPSMRMTLTGIRIVEFISLDLTNGGNVAQIDWDYPSGKYVDEVPDPTFADDMDGTLYDNRWVRLEYSIDQGSTWTEFGVLTRDSSVEIGQAKRLRPSTSWHTFRSTNIPLPPVAFTSETKIRLVQPTFTLEDDLIWTLYSVVVTDEFVPIRAGGKAGEVVGIVVGSVAGVVALAACVAVLCRMRSAKSGLPKQSDTVVANPMQEERNKQLAAVVVVGKTQAEQPAHAEAAKAQSAGPPCCGNCGAAIASGSTKFCGECGARL